jgi:ELWxxDGT repeat protein
MKKQALLTAFAAMIGTGSIAQTGITKLDINTGSGSSYPLHIIPFGSGVACYATNGSRGWELHTTDGVAAPVMVADLNPLAGSAIGQFFNRPVGVINSTIYFTADNGASGYELFKYTGSGTPSVIDIELGGNGSSPDDYAVLNGVLYFRASTSAEGYELWSYNPAITIPTRLTDIRAGIDSSVTGNIIPFNGKIYFTANDNGNNNELWVFDPALQMTQIVADINTGGSSNPMHLVVLNGKLYFSADDGNFGRELYMYDGTNAPTRLTDAAAGSFDGMPDTKAPLITYYNNKIYFVGNNTSLEKQVYVYDATTGNATVAANPNGTNSSEPSWLTLYNGKIYFVAYSNTNGLEIWSYNGSTTKLEIELCTGANSSNPQQLTAIGDNLYFRAVDCGGIGEELFRFNFKEVSVTNISFHGKATLYPNPASTTATLQLQLNKAEDLLVNITDMQGRTVYTTGIQHYNSGETQLAIPASRLQTGVYMCSVISNTGSRLTSMQLIVK